LLATLLLLAHAGCSVVPTAGSLPSILPGEKPPVTEQAEQAHTAGKCIVELRTGTRRPQMSEVPLGTDTRVQDVLDASRATSKFRNLDVCILRPTSHASEPMLKLSCRFDHKKRRISWETDYAVLPGDRVVVREGIAVGLEKMFGAMLGG
jgi:hypothetical protein